MEVEGLKKMKTGLTGDSDDDDDNMNSPLLSSEQRFHHGYVIHKGITRIPPYYICMHHVKNNLGDYKERQARSGTFASIEQASNWIEDTLEYLDSLLPWNGKLDHIPNKHEALFAWLFIRHRGGERESGRRGRVGQPHLILARQNAKKTFYLAKISVVNHRPYLILAR